MTTYNDKTEDEKGRQIKPILTNTVKDGSGTAYFPIVTDDGQLIVQAGAGTASIGKVDHTSTGIAVGRQTVGTAGTAVALGTAAAKWVIVTAETDNTNTIVVGGTGVVATLATRTGTPLEPGDSVSLLIDNLGDVFINALVNTEGATFTYGT